MNRMNVVVGLQFTFTKYLVPEISGRIGKKIKEGIWKFVGKLVNTFLHSVLFLKGGCSTKLSFTAPNL